MATESDIDKKKKDATNEEFGDFWTMLMSSGLQWGSGLTNQLAQIGSGMMAGEATMLDSFIPEEAQGFLPVIRAGIKLASSSLYDGLLSGATSGGLDPSKMMGNKTPAMIIAQKQRADKVSDIRKNVAKKVINSKKERLADSLLRAFEPKKIYDENVERQFRDSLKEEAQAFAAQRMSGRTDDIRRGLAVAYQERYKGVYDKVFDKPVDLKKASMEQVDNFLQNVYQEKFYTEKQSKETETLKTAVREKFAEQAGEARIKDIQKGSLKWKATKAAVEALMSPVNDAARDVAASFSDNVLSFSAPDGVGETIKQIKRDKDGKVEKGADGKPIYETVATTAGTQKSVLEQVLSSTADQFINGEYGFNTAADMATVSKDVIRRNASTIRNIKVGDTKAAAQISEQLREETDKRLKSYDKFRSVFGKKASVVQINEQLTKLGLMPANAAAQEFGYMANRIEQLAVNTGMSKKDIAQYSTIAGGVASDYGLKPGLYQSAMGIETAATVGRGTTVRGLSNVDYAQATAASLANKITQGREANITAALDAVDSAVSKGKITKEQAAEFRKKAAGVTSEKDFRALAKSMNLSSTETDNIMANIQYSDNRNEAVKHLSDQQVNENVKVAQASVKRMTGKDASKEQLQKIFSLTGTARTKAIEDLGMSVAKFNTAVNTAAAASDFGDNTLAFQQSIVDGAENRKNADTAVKDNTGKFSTVANEAIMQVIQKKGKNASAADIVHAALSGTELDEDSKKKIINNEKIQKIAQNFVQAAASGDKEKEKAAKATLKAAISKAGGITEKEEQGDEEGAGAKKGGDAKTSAAGQTDKPAQSGKSSISADDMAATVEMGLKLWSMVSDGFRTVIPLLNQFNEKLKQTNNPS